VHIKVILFGEAFVELLAEWTCALTLFGVVVFRYLNEFVLDSFDLVALF